MAIKKILKLVWEEFIYGDHVLSLGALSIALTSASLLNVRLTWDFLVIVYLGVYLVYLYNHYKEIPRDTQTNIERVKCLQKYSNKVPFLIFFCLFIILVLQLFRGKTKSLLLSMFMISFGLLYTLFFKSLTKKIVGFKSFFVAFVWALIVLFLVVFYSKNIDVVFLLMFVFVFLRIFIGVTFSDIKDMDSDKKEELKTLPLVLGKEKTVFFLQFINILALIPIFLGFYLKLFPSFVISLSLTSLYAFYYLQKSKNPKIDLSFLTHNIVYSENLWWFIFILLGKIFIK